MKNATQDANKSFDQKLIDIISQQNDFNLLIQEKGCLH
jgi:hypothetical protein